VPAPVDSGVQSLTIRGLADVGVEVDISAISGVLWEYDRSIFSEQGDVKLRPVRPEKLEDI